MTTNGEELYRIGFNDGVIAAAEILIDHDKVEALEILYSLADEVDNVEDDDD